MRRLILIAVVVLTMSPVFAQDIVGLEDCAQARGADKKIGCLQSNVGYLHGLIRKNEAAAQAQLKDQAAKLVAATARVELLVAEIETLKALLDKIEKAAAPKPPAPNATPPK